MEAIKQTLFDQWDQTIDAGVSKIETLQSDIEGIADAIDIGGMKEGINIAFEQIYEAASDLQGQISLIKDEVKDIESDPNCDITRDQNGDFAIVLPG
jgi:hypothetical protein